MLSIFGRAGAILLAAVDVSHALYAQSCVEGSAEAQHEAFMDKLEHIAGMFHCIIYYVYSECSNSLESDEMHDAMR